MMTLLWGLSLCLASGESGAESSAPSENRGRWRVVAMYDTATLLTGSEQPTGGDPWRPAPGMTESCGPARRPFGMNTSDMAAVSSGVSPALAVLLRRVGEEDLGPVAREDIRVSLKQEDRSFRLEPAVSPLALRVQIVGDADRRYVEQVRTQLETELCLEHKVGRAWIGGSSAFLKQAFRLKDPPSLLPDQGAFGGQLAPVPALMGPPDACVVESGEQSRAPRSRGAQAAASLDLVDADIWGASLRSCGPQEGELSPAGSVKPLPWSLARTSSSSNEALPARTLWQTLRVTLHENQDGDPTFDLELQSSREVGHWQTLASGRELVEALPADEEGVGRTSLADIAALLPRALPTLGPAEDPGRYTLVVLPEWQLELGLRRIYGGEAPSPDLDLLLSLPGPVPADAVGWLLEHPELLKIQVHPGARADGEGDSLWPDLMASMSSAVSRPGAPGSEWLPLRWRDWGFPAGLLSAREPIALPGEAPTSEQVISAQRAVPHAVFLGTGALLTLILATGLRRVRDLWLPVPEERVSYWPSDGEPEPEGATPPKVPQAEPSR